MCMYVYKVFIYVRIEHSEAVLFVLPVQRFRPTISAPHCDDY